MFTLIIIIIVVIIALKEDQNMQKQTNKQQQQEEEALKAAVASDPGKFGSRCSANGARIDVYNLQTGASFKYADCRSSGKTCVSRRSGSVSSPVCIDTKATSVSNTGGERNVFEGFFSPSFFFIASLLLFIFYYVGLNGRKGLNSKLFRR